MPLDPPIVSDSRPLMVTGASGFIGSRVVAELETRGEHVLAVVRQREPHMPTVSGTTRPESTVEYVECDLLNRAAVAHLIERHRPQACIHAAWDVGDPDYMSSAANQEWVRASLHMAGHMMRWGCKWLGFCGTHIEPPEPCGPANRYAAAKATLRHRLHDLASTFNPPCRIAWFHIFQPYGPGEPAHRFLPSLITAAVSGEEFELKHPHALRDFVHVDDIASAIAEASQNRLRGRFDIGTGRVRFLHEIASIVERLAGAKACVHWRNEASRGPSLDPVNRVANIQPLVDETGWRPTIDLEAGLRELVEYAASQLQRSK
jgi:nucleoside-diphosphate-sugar epimerase